MLNFGRNDKDVKGHVFPLACFLMSICQLASVDNKYSLYIVLVAGAANASYSAEATDRIRSSNPTGPGIRMQFKQPVTKNLNYETSLEKNVSKSIFYYLLMLFFMKTVF